jgi:hypothetical protein
VEALGLSPMKSLKDSTPESLCNGELLMNKKAENLNLCIAVIVSYA